MATIKFRLNGNTDPNKEVAINVRFNVNGERAELSTAERIAPRYWDQKRQEVKSNFRGSVEINQSLLRIKNDLIEMWRQNKTATITELKEKARPIIRYGTEAIIQKKKTVHDLKVFVGQFIEKCESGTIIRKPATIQTYKATFEHLCWFSEYSGHPLTFAAITLDFYYDFCQYCWDILGHEDSTLGKSVKILKMFMQEAQSMDLHSNMSFRKKQFRKLEGQSDSIYLTEDEILKIYNLDLEAKGRPDLIESRDLFVFDCWVGLRYSDLANIQPYHVQNGTIRICTQKTGEDVVIPLHPIAQAIYNKYEALPTAKANPIFNKEIKEIAEMAELTSRVQFRTLVRGVADFTWTEKYNMVTAHTARRSFATNCYKMGIPTRSIMAITGHKTEKAFNKYIKLSKDEHAAIVLDVFNKQFKPNLKIA